MRSGVTATAVTPRGIMSTASRSSGSRRKVGNPSSNPSRLEVPVAAITADSAAWPVMPVSVRWKLAAGNAAAYNLVRSSSSETLGAYTQLTTSAQIQRDIVMNDPATGIAWDPTGVANMKLAYRVA